MSDLDMRVDLGGIRMKNPVTVASGTFGYGAEYAKLVDVTRLGAITVKGIRLQPWSGNPLPRHVEVPGGMVNAMGLQGPGVEGFARDYMPFLRTTGVPVIVNIWGTSEEEYAEVARRLSEVEGVSGLELNISCPNVKAGGMAFGMLPDTAADITEKVKAVSRHPVMVKLSPNAPELVAVACACESAGADALSLVNTFLGMAIDIKKKRPVFENVYAGLSGPAILPIALRMVHQVAHAVRIPVVGMGGITSAEDALKFLMAGAVAVQVGTMTFADPKAMLAIIDGLAEYCAQEGLANLQEIVGII